MAWRGWSSSLQHGPGPVASIQEWQRPRLVDQFEICEAVCRAFLTSNVVLFFAWFNTLVSSHNIWCCCPQACFAMANLSVSSHLVVALCFFMQVSRALFVSLIYTWPNCKGSGTQLPTSSWAGLGPWLLSAVCGGWMPIGRLFGYCIFCIPISQLHLGLLHRGWTLLLRVPLLTLSMCRACWRSLQRPQDTRSLPRLLWGGPLYIILWAMVHAWWKRQETMPSFTWCGWWEEKFRYQSVWVGFL